jgi:hypothetical protein
LKFSLDTLGAAAQEQPGGRDRVNSSEGSAPSLKNLAELYRDEGKYNEANVLYQRSLAIAETTLAPKRPEIAAMRISYSSFLQELEQKSQATEITFPTQEVE